MYVWTAIDLENQLKELRPRAQAVERELSLPSSALTLPFHISLKISFEVRDEIYPYVMDTLLSYFQTVKPFDVQVSGIEIENAIVWIRMKENTALRQIHADLDRILLERHNVEPHPFDLDFKFHTTLFLDSDEQKISEAYRRIKDIPIPNVLRANSLLIGTSESGAIGTYHVTHRIGMNVG